jgi:hypothetical protein
MSYLLQWLSLIEVIESTIVIGLVSHLKGVICFLRFNFLAAY